MDQLTPIYRIEFFLDAIVNNSVNDLDPVYRVEFFLAKLAGRAVEIPQPLSRMEMFLAQLCGETVTLPTPQSRTEQYLAAICGEDVEIPPFPVYRIEYWLAAWAEGGSEIVTVTGIAPLALLDAVAHPIHSLTQYGKCVQDGTPTPTAPADILTNNGVLKYSANMADVNEQTARVGYYISAQGAVLADSYNWFYLVFVPVKPNTSYTLSMSTPVYYVTISEYSTPEDSGFVIRKNGTTGSNSSLTITTGANTNFLRFGANINRGPIALETVLGINWMLNLGDTAMDYQPYVEGGIYTDGEDEVLTVSGANLLDPSTSNITIGEYVSAGGSTFVGANNWRTDFIPVEGGKTYAFWGRKKEGNTISAYNRINWYTANKVHISPRTTIIQDTVTVGTAPSNAAYAMLSCAPVNSANPITRDTFDEYNWMFAEASAEIPYQPYVTPQTVTDIPMLLGVGDYKDEVELISGLLTHKIGIKVFDGTEAWRASSSANIYILESAIGVGLTAICTHFQKVANNTSAVNMPDGSFKGHSSNAILYFKDVSAGDVDGFKARIAAQYAAGTPVIMLYSLATETTEQTTPHALHTSAGTNVVDVTAAVEGVEMAVEYAKESA